MSRARKQRRRRGEALALPDDLIEALGRLEGGDLDEPEILARITEGVKALHEGLTRTRQGWVGGRYLRRGAQGAAYGTYYLCANIAKLWPILDQLAVRGLIAPGRLRALEIGGGPGTGALALALWARRQGWPAPRVDLSDLHRDPLIRAQRVWRDLGLPEDQLRIGAVDLSRGIGGQVAQAFGPGGGYDLLLSCNVFNELSEDEDERLIPELAALVKPEGLWLCLSPADRRWSRRAIRLRDRAIERRWHVVAPCTRQDTCPALEDERDWCHGEWAFERPDFMVEVDKRVGTRREVIKATWWVAAHPKGPHKAVEVPEGLRPARVVSERFDEKGRVSAILCDLGGRRRVELQRRDFAPHNRGLAEAVRHDLLAITPGLEGRLSPEDQALPVAQRLDDLQSADTTSE